MNNIVAAILAIALAATANLPAPALNTVDIYDNAGNHMRVTTACADLIQGSGQSFTEIHRSGLTATNAYQTDCVGMM